jgi:dynactin complex subunit
MLLENINRETSQISQLKNWLRSAEKTTSTKMNSRRKRLLKIFKQMNLKPSTLRETLEITFWK